MARPRTGSKLSPVPLNLDRDLMDKFEETLPKNKSISKAIREYMLAVVDENEKGKKLIAHDLGAIKLSGISNNRYENTLDKYFPQWLQDHKDWKTRQEIFDSMTEDQQCRASEILTNNAEIWKNLYRTKQVMIKKMRVR